MQQNAANQLKAAIKRKKEENTIGFKKIENENDQLDQQIKAVSKLQDTIRRKLPLNTSTQKMQNDMLFMKKRMKKLKDDIDNCSATDIQRAFRGHKLP